MNDSGVWLQAKGRVFLVGAGPGDPLLLTRRAARLLAEADVVVLDRRSLESIAALAPASAERCFVGRTADGPGWKTERVVELLVERATAGSTVVRLKSGDPFVCSRGGEEREALLQRGVACEVVPGVTAATGYISMDNNSIVEGTAWSGSTRIPSRTR